MELAGQPGFRRTKAMAKHGTHSMAFKRRFAQELLAAETLHQLPQTHDLSRNLIRVWVEKEQAGAFDENTQAADLIQEYEARIAALKRLLGNQAVEFAFLNGASAAKTAVEKRAHVRDHRRGGMPVAEGCSRVSIARSMFYETPADGVDATALVEATHAIKDEFEACGLGRMRAALRQNGGS